MPKVSSQTPLNIFIHFKSFVIFMSTLCLIPLLKLLIFLQCQKTRISPKTEKVTAANQNWEGKNLKFRQPIINEYYVTQKRPRAFDYGWGPSLVFSSGQIAVVSIVTQGLQPLHRISSDILLSQHWKFAKFNRLITVFEWTTLWRKRMLLIFSSNSSCQWKLEYVLHLSLCC